MRSRLESYLFTYTTTNIVQEIIKLTSIQVQIFIAMNLNMNNNSNNNHNALQMNVVAIIIQCLLKLMNANHSNQQE